MARQRPNRKIRHRLPTPSTEAERTTEVDFAAVEEMKRRAETIVFSQAEPPEEGVASLAEEIRALPSETTAAQVVRQIGQSWGERAIPLLENLAVGRDKTIELESVRMLGTVRSAAAVRALNRITETASSKEVRKEARRSLFKLRSAGLDVDRILSEEKPEPERLEQRQPNIWRAAASTYDFEGDRVIVVAVEKPFGGIESAISVINETKGIVAFGVRDTNKRKWFREEIEPMDIPEKGKRVIEIPPDYAKHLLKVAYEKNKAAREEVPPTFRRLRPLLTTPEREYERAIVYEEISPLEIKWNPEFLEESPGLFRLPEFRHWRFETSKLVEFANELKELGEGIITLPPWVEKERKQGIQKRALEKLLTPEERERFKRQLEETAYILLHTERPKWARAALAAAISLEGADIAHLVANPFVLTLVNESMAYAIAEIESEYGEQAPGSELLVEPGELSRYIDAYSGIVRPS